MERSEGGTHQANPGENGPSNQDDGEGNKAIQPTHERELPAEQIPVTERERVREVGARERSRQLTQLEEREGEKGRDRREKRETAVVT